MPGPKTQFSSLASAVFCVSFSNEENCVEYSLLFHTKASVNRAALAVFDNPGRVFARLDVSAAFEVVQHSQLLGFDHPLGL